jgi:hypothetical protein
MVKHSFKQRQWILAVFVSVTVMGALLLLSSDLVSVALPYAENEVVIEPVGHFGGTIGSLAVPSAGGDYLYAGEGTGFTVIDVSDGSQPRQVGSLPLPGSDVNDIAVSGSLVFLTNGDGLHAVDLSDPVTPTLLSSLDAPGYASSVAVAVAVAHAYVAADDAGLWVVDVSDPTDPQEATSYPTPGSAKAVDVAGTVAYVTDGASLLSLDVSNPANPAQMDTYNAPMVQDVCVTGNTAFLARGFFGLETVDVADPTNLAPLGSRAIDGFARGVQIIGTTAYVAPRESGLHILDVSNPANPNLLGTTDPDWEANVAAVSHQAVAYIAPREKALRIVDVSNPGNPDVLGAYERPNAVMDVITDLPHGYIAGLDRLWVLDMTNPALPAPLATADLQGNPGEPRRLSLSPHAQTGDPLIYVADWSYGVEIFNVADPATPTLLGHYPVPDEHEVNDVFALGQYAYALTADDDDGQLHILDVSDPANPEEVEAYDTPGDARQVFVTDTVAFVADGPAGVRLIDVSDPDNPGELGHVDPPSGASTDVVLIDGDRAYIGSNKDGVWWLQAFDVSDPVSPTLAASQQGVGYLNDIDVDEMSVYSVVSEEDLNWRSRAVRPLSGAQDADRLADDGAPGMRVYAKSDLAASGQYTFKKPDSVHGFQRYHAGKVVRYIIFDKKSAGSETAKDEATYTPTPGTPTTTPTVTPTPTPVASWSKAGTDEAAPGHVIPYFITLRWDSPDGSPAPSTMTDLIPKYTQYVPGSASANLGTVDTSHPSYVRWQGNIPDGGAAVIHFNVIIPCDELMKMKLEDWPEEIKNDAVGSVGPFNYFVSKSTELLKPDITISGLEVNQSIQNLNNDQLLIEWKETYARLYIQAGYRGGVDGCGVPDVTAKLSGGPGADLEPINGSITAEVLPGQDRPTQDERDDLNKSLYFRLPRPWRSPDYKLTAEVNPDGERPDEDTENNTEEHDMSFVDTDRLYLYLVPIKYTYQGANLQPPQFRL